MSKTAWIVIAVVLALLLGVVALGMVVALYTWVEPPKDQPVEEFLVPDPPPGFDVEPAPELDAPTLRGPDTPTDANMARRMAALEREVKSLRDELAAERAATKPMREMFDKAKEQGFVGSTGLNPEGVPFGEGGEVVMDDSMLTGGALAKKLAGAVGLEGERAKAFGKAYDDFLGKVKALEKEHAKVTKDGDTTTITIPRLGQAGDQLRREWDDYVDGALSNDEKQAYDKAGTRNRLLGARVGDWARTVTIKESGGSIDIREAADDGKGGKSEQHMQGPAMARDLMLRDYAHLLK